MRSDSELVRAAQAGDADALEVLLTRHQPQLWRYARRMCGSVAEAEDAMQEGLLAAVRGLAGYRGDAAWRTWLSSVVRHACFRQRRRHAEAAPATAAAADSGWPSRGPRRRAAPAPISFSCSPSSWRGM